MIWVKYLIEHEFHNFLVLWILEVCWKFKKRVSCASMEKKKKPDLFYMSLIRYNTIAYNMIIQYFIVRQSVIFFLHHSIYVQNSSNHDTNVYTQSSCQTLQSHNMNFYIIHYIHKTQLIHDSCACDFWLSALFNCKITWCRWFKSWSHVPLVWW